jgi:uncharacterized membrane-anchored protein
MVETKNTCIIFVWKSLGRPLGLKEIDCRMGGGLYWLRILPVVHFGTNGLKLSGPASKDLIGW